MDPWIHGSAAGAAARAAAGAAAGAAASAAAVCIYYVLGAITLEQRVRRCVASCEVDCRSRASKLEQHNAGGVRNA